MLIIGIDPGKDGGIAAVWKGVPDAIKMPPTPHDVADYLAGYKATEIAGPIKAYIEKVHSMPKQGVASSFTFGQGYGVLIGALSALCIPYELVTPQTWQKAMGCMTKGDKNVSKAAAQRLFPSIKMTHAIADALLIAEYGRRTEAARG